MADLAPRRPGRPRITEFKSPLTLPDAEAAGPVIIRELAPEVALPTLEVLRHVLMWAAETPGERGDLFEPCAMTDWEIQLLEHDWEPDIRLPLAVLVGELANGEKALPEAVARACLVVADWAFGQRAAATALVFAEAAALAWPQSPRYAWAAGRLLRAHGRVREAERWLNRASHTAARENDPDSQVLALNTLGNLHRERGDFARAARVLANGLRIARRHDLREREGETLHDLFVLSTARGDLDGAEQLAVEAFEIYRDGHPRLPALVHDRAVVWMERGQFSRALHALRELPPLIEEPQERAWATALLARAAAACGDEALFERAWARAWALLEQSEWMGAAGAFVDLGLGASSLQRWEQAEQALQRARGIAPERGDTDPRTNAALDAVAARRVAERDRDPEDPRASVPLDVWTTEGAPADDTLAARFAAALRQLPRTRKGG
jgi:tetratricopeptide (TPR) repeat protein